MAIKKLTRKTWDEVEKEMSIAGSAEKIVKLGKDIESLMESSIDPSNRAELTNVEFMLQCLIDEIKLMQRAYDKSHRI